jgi:hypothetical protein
MFLEFRSINRFFTGFSINRELHVTSTFRLYYQSLLMVKVDEPSFWPTVLRLLRRSKSSLKAAKSPGALYRKNLSADSDGVRSTIT